MGISAIVLFLLFKKKLEMEVLDKEISSRLLDTLSGLNQERMRLKKRRIESHFKDTTNITGAAFTIASEEVGDTVVGGYFLRLNAKSPLKPMPLASEGYCLDRVHGYLLSPVFYALYMLYCMELDHSPISFHFTSTKVMERCSSLLSGEALPKNLVEESICFLCKLLPKVEILSCIKGPFFEKMQSRMYLVKHHNINELISLDFEIIARSLLIVES